MKSTRSFAVGKQLWIWYVTRPVHLQDCADSSSGICSRILVTSGSIIPRQSFVKPLMRAPGRCRSYLTKRPRRGHRHHPSPAAQRRLYSSRQLSISCRTRCGQKFPSRACEGKSGTRAITRCRKRTRANDRGRSCGAVIKLP